MRLYDFSIYAERRKERLAAQAVAEVAADLNSPGSVKTLKARVSDWLVLHQSVVKRAS